mmetsp:Transcript_16996/g.64753  ORF Transcript_16996/g.64753 Transcript_16996/m.64753 type:complete len:315 (-) Transcript_16996:232-1176(-)
MRHVRDRRPALRVFSAREEAVVVVHVSVRRRLRMQVPHPRDLRQRLPEMRLHGQAIPRREGTQAAQHLRRAGRHEARRHHRRDQAVVDEDVAIALARLTGRVVAAVGRSALISLRLGRGHARVGLDPFLAPLDELLGRLQALFSVLDVVLGTVAIHADLAHVCPLSGLAHDVDEKLGGFQMQRSEVRARRGACTKVPPHASLVHLPGVAEVLEARLAGEGVGLQPLQQRQVHARARPRVLGSVRMAVHEAGHDEAAALVHHLVHLLQQGLRAGGRHVQHMRDDAVSAQQNGSIRDERGFLEGLGRHDHASEGLS